MAVNARTMMMQAADVAKNHISSIPQLVTRKNGHDNEIISNLVFAQSKSVRTSTIILAAFNVLAAFATASSILYDCYWASKRCNPRFKASKFCVSSIHPAETFPLVLAIGIFLQGLVFAVVQGEGLRSLYLTTECDTIAQFMWPALFIVPYIQLVFGLECAIRSFRATPFQPRGKYDVTLCIAAVVLMLIGTWVPSNIFPEGSKCFASLVWFITRYGVEGFVILSIVGGLMVVCAVTIFVRLLCVPTIEPHQRITASRMVYYLVIGIVSLAFVIPYFSSLLSSNGKNGDLELAMMATVVLNLSGLMNGLLQLFLRSNTATTAFGPKVGRGWERSRHEIRIFGLNELAMHAQLMNPVTGPRSPTKSEWAHSRSSLVGKEKGPRISMESLTASPHQPKSPIETELESMPWTTQPAEKQVLVAHAHKSSYSIFPNANKGPQPTSIYDISNLEPPPTVHLEVGSRHKRDSSVTSSATVQIGLRLSHAPTPSQEDLNNLPLSSTTNNAKLSMLALPATTYKVATLPISSFSAKAAPLSSPLRVKTDFATAPLASIPTPPARNANRPSPVITNSMRSPEESPSQTSLAIHKNLPPTPKFSFPAIETVRDSNTHLSPAVYTPEKKAPAPGLGALGGGPRSATLTQQSNPLRANPLDRSNSGRVLLPVNAQRTKRDWI